PTRQAATACASRSRSVDADARVRRDVGEDQVAKLAARALSQAHHRVVHARREGARAHEGHPVKGRVRARRARVPRVHLTAAVTPDAHHREQELALADVAIVRVEGVVAREEHRQVLDVHGAAEELEAVVRIVRHLAVVDDGAGADAAKGDAVDLVVRADDRAAVPHPHVLQGARRLGGRGAAVRVAGDALDRRGGRHVGRRVAEQDEAAPLAALAQPRCQGIAGAVCHGRLRENGRQSDWAARRARRHERAALHDHDRWSGDAVGRRQRKDGGASRDRERDTRLHEDLGGKNVRDVRAEGRVVRIAARQEGDIRKQRRERRRQGRSRSARSARGSNHLAAAREPRVASEPVVRRGPERALAAHRREEGVAVGWCVLGACARQAGNRRQRVEGGGAPRKISGGDGSEAG
ncbi:hypothetical protein Ctob_011333, partial [Chrysochromulina tobinii]